MVLSYQCCDGDSRNTFFPRFILILIVIPSKDGWWKPVKEWRTQHHLITWPLLVFLVRMSLRYQELIRLTTRGGLHSHELRDYVVTHPRKEFADRQKTKVNLITNRYCKRQLFIVHQTKTLFIWTIGHKHTLNNDRSRWTAPKDAGELFQAVPMHVIPKSSGRTFKILANALF